MADTKRNPDDADQPTTDADDLVAYLDGELDPNAADAMATKLSLDPRLRAKAEAYQRTWDILDVLPKPEPSPTFATRTLSQIAPVPSVTQVTVPQSSLAVATYPPPGSGVGFWLASGAVILAAAAAGYLGHMAFTPKAADPPLEDVPMTKNMRLYRHVDDMEYLKRLDTPELFGDESE